MPFRNRSDAGRRLARRVQDLGLDDPVVVALPRGGVPVAAEVAKALDAPLDILVVRKLGHPLQPELALGAIAEDGATFVDQEMVSALRVSREALERVLQRERAELRRRVNRYRGAGYRTELAGRDVVVVDDGLATGSTAAVALEAVRNQHARRVVLAVPVGSPDAVTELGRRATVVCLETPAAFGSVGVHYDDFLPVTDDEVVGYLAAQEPRAPEARPDGTAEVVVEVAGGVHLPGLLEVPPGSDGIVVFAHGSGSSRLSPRNQQVARVIRRAGFGTLLFDLLTVEEAEDRHNVFDIDLLAGRMVDATGWLLDEREPERVGYLGASTGAAAALVAAAALGSQVHAVVSRGGRVDLAGKRLASVTSPTLLVVGGLDTEVLRLNRWASSRLLRCQHEMVVVPGATHLFEEPGTLERAASVSASWFARHLGSPGPARSPLEGSHVGGGQSPVG
jgi:putative phosphoribosyl transferase